MPLALLAEKFLEERLLLFGKGAEFQGVAPAILIVRGDVFWVDEGAGNLFDEQGGIVEEQVDLESTLGPFVTGEMMKGEPFHADVEDLAGAISAIEQGLVVHFDPVFMAIVPGGMHGFSLCKGMF
jgi:hypothetical protein